MNNRIRVELEVFWVLIDPDHWLRNRSTGKGINRFISDNIDNPMFEYESKHIIKLNGKSIWISNYPYCYGYFYKGGRGLPSRINVYRLKRAVDKFLEDNNK